MYFLSQPVVSEHLPYSVIIEPGFVLGAGEAPGNKTQNPCMEVFCTELTLGWNNRHIKK